MKHFDFCGLTSYTHSTFTPSTSPSLAPTYTLTDEPSKIPFAVDDGEGEVGEQDLGATPTTTELTEDQVYTDDGSIPVWITVVLGALVVLLVVILVALRLKRNQGGTEEVVAVDMVGVLPPGHQAQTSNVSNASMYGKDFETQGHEHGVDVVQDRERNVSALACVDTDACGDEAVDIDCYIECSAVNRTCAELNLVADSVNNYRYRGARRVRGNNELTVHCSALVSTSSTCLARAGTPLCSRAVSETAARCPCLF